MMDHLEEHIQKQLGKIKRVCPEPELFERIEQRLAQASTPVVFISQQRFAAAAALLILMNAGILWATITNSPASSEEPATYSLVSDYSIYANE